MMELRKDFTWHFEIDTDPRPKGRPRFTSRGRTYTPQRTRDFETLIQHSLLQQAPPEPLSGPLSVRMIFFLHRPNSHLQKSGGLKKGSPEYPSGHVGDLDNFIKAIGDAGNGLLWKDDSQIIDLQAHKRYADQTTHRVVISIEKIDSNQVSS